MKEEKETETSVSPDCAQCEEYAFYLEQTGLTAEVSEDGETITFYANGSRYRFSAPFSDAAAGRDVRYALSPLENGVSLLRVIVCYARYNREEKELPATLRPPV